jgi:hypothetical protein
VFIKIGLINEEKSDAYVRWTKIFRTNLLCLRCTLKTIHWYFQPSIVCSLFSGNKTFTALHFIAVQIHNKFVNYLPASDWTRTFCWQDLSKSTVYKMMGYISGVFNYVCRHLSNTRSRFKPHRGIGKQDFLLHSLRKNDNKVMDTTGWNVENMWHETTETHDIHICMYSGKMYDVALGNTLEHIHVVRCIPLVILSKGPPVPSRVTKDI